MDAWERESCAAEAARHVVAYAVGRSVVRSRRREEAVVARRRVCLQEFHDALAGKTSRALDRELRLFQRLRRRLVRLGRTKTDEGFYAARAMWGWAPRFGARLVRKQGRGRAARTGSAEVEATRRSALPRGARSRLCRPSGLPRGQRRTVTLSGGPALWCLSAGLLARRVGPQRVRKQPRFVSLARAVSSIDGSSSCRDGVPTAGEACVLDFGGRLGRWRKKCLEVAVLSLCGGSLKHAVKTRLLRSCSITTGQVLRVGWRRRATFVAFSGFCVRWGSACVS